MPRFDPASSQILFGSDGWMRFLYMTAWAPSRTSVLLMYGASGFPLMLWANVSPVQFLFSMFITQTVLMWWVMESGMTGAAMDCWATSCVTSLEAWVPWP